MPEPSKYTGPVQRSWAPVTMVTCDAGKKVNFLHGCVVYKLNILFAVRCKHVPFSSAVKTRTGFVRGFVPGLYRGCANTVVPACKGWLLWRAKPCCVLRRGRGLTEHREILGLVPRYPGDFLLKNLTAFSTTLSFRGHSCVCSVLAASCSGNPSVWAGCRLPAQSGTSQELLSRGGPCLLHTRRYK